ncbi:MAG TPA: protein translocase subunit SecF [Candidatus Methylomirabilis sp.]
MEIIGKTSIDFIGRRHIAYAVSGVLVLVGILATVQVWRGHANLGVDFTGGTTVQLRFEHPPDLGAVRRTLVAAGLEPELQTLERGERLLVRLRKAEEAGAGTGKRVEEVLRAGLPQERFTVEGTNEVGPAIGRELLVAAQKAILVSLIGIVLYIWWRFEFTFGVAATLATFLDVLAVLGVVWVLGHEMTFLTVTALLTLAGYSLTDTVVVYDRIRENLRGRRRGNFGEVINASINEMLARTAMTSLTVLLAVLALLILGGAVLWDFAFALFLGVIAGTYSSWFVASPIVYEWRTRVQARGKPKK